MNATGASLVAVASFGALLADQERRWRRSGSAIQTRFLPDGTPAMNVMSLGPRADSAQTVQSKAVSRA